jgi:hypothetical protein
MTFDQIITMTLDINWAFDTIVALLFPLLTSSPVMWRKEHLWTFSVLQRVHPSSLVKFAVVKNNTKVLFLPVLNFTVKQTRILV